MATDMLYEEFVDRFDLKVNGEDFLKGGIMDPKELYLQDVAQCQDTSSSDSGISTVDDLQDIANITDLNNILDTDFSLEFALSTFEQDVFDSDFLVKSEPQSPAGYCQQFDTVFLNDVTLKNEESHITLQDYHRVDGTLSPASSANSPQQTYTYQSSPEPLSPQLEPSSPTPTLNSQPSFLDTTFTIIPSVGQNQPLKVHSDPPNSVYSLDPMLKAGVPSPSSIIVMPGVQKQNKISILPSTGGVFVSASDARAPAPATINIDSILNSKIRIKPKPGSEVIVPTGATQWVSTTASSQVSFVGQQPVSLLGTSSVISGGGGPTSVTDERSLKRAQRIIKNRESASLSRKRKKEYMTSLEERLQQCRDENERLCRENAELKQKLEHLQRENITLKFPSLSPAKKICLMCLGLLLVLNLSPFSFMNQPNNTSPGPLSQNYPVTGRHLMSVDVDRMSESSDMLTNKDMWPPSMLMHFDEELSLLAEKLNITGKLGNMCPMYFNSTESNRLAEQLRRWMISQEEEKKKTERKQQKKKKNYPPLRRFGSTSFNSNTQSVPDSQIIRPVVTEHNYPVQVFSNGADPRQQLLNAIPRRNDTFYVLSFSTDYFLVPATAHNKTMRPRMSLLMPVVTPSINDSTNQDSVGMMQIDCEILTTNIINVHRSAFPEDGHYNSTSFERNRGSSKPVDEDAENLHSKKEGKSDRDSVKNHSSWKNLRKTVSG